MRIVAVETTNIGGLRDARLTLPPAPIAALAGANGTGKSKLLACLLSPWTRSLPSQSQGELSTVAVELSITEKEAAGLSDLSSLVGWGTVSVPTNFQIITTFQPLTGIGITSEPEQTVLTNFTQMAEFMRSWPSLDVIYLPAERRLLPGQSAAIDLNQLSETIAHQMTINARGAVQNHGRLDDAEFEQFARALSVASQLQDDPEEAGSTEAISRVDWDSFASTVNELIAPKNLLPLTRRHPENLRIRTANGKEHAVQDLSSGERQALIIISRILRAGTGHNVFLIDEPDAYLHPHLSRRLALALESSVGTDGQLVLATHSPAVLDTLSPSSIIRLSHAADPSLVADEEDRLNVYRDTGFRASALTQSDLLLICEGESDVSLLPLLLPELARASLIAAGGRAAVVADVQRLHPFDLPVLGVVDGDVLPPPIPASIASLVTVWPAPDLEGVFLLDDLTLEVMIERGFAAPHFADISKLRGALNGLYQAYEHNFIAEAAQRLLRQRENVQWPSPKGEKPVERLRQVVRGMRTPTEPQLEECMEQAQAMWEDGTQSLYGKVRGKYVLGSFASQCSTMKSGQALLEAVARSRPALTGLAPLKSAVAAAL